jgi:hypothetical protein
MRKTMFTASVMLVVGSVLCPLNARRMFTLSYRELFRRSDVVVIATPTAQTTDTAETSFLPDIFSQDAQGRQSRIASVGVETPFKVSVILKGEQTLERFVLHHYREAAATSTDSPMLLSFDPSARRGSYLMFVIRETDGRYAPTGGQTDPGYNSVVMIPLDPATFKTGR